MSEQMPEWVRKPFFDFLSEMDDIGGSMLLISLGFSALATNPSVIQEKIIQENPMPEGIHISNTVMGIFNNGKALETVGKQFVVALCSSLEVFIYDFLIQWMKNEQSYLQDEEIGRIKISLIEYMRMTEDERSYYLLDMLKQALKTPLKQGVNAFEPLLDRFKLGGSIDDDTKQKLFELSNVRNIIVHKRGVIDQRFTKSCPWLQVHIGDTFVVSPEICATYSYAVQEYIKIIFLRVKKYFDEQ